MEFGIDDVVVLSNEDKEEIKMYNLVHGVPNMLNMMKKEAMTVTELEEKMARG